VGEGYEDAGFGALVAEGEVGGEVCDEGVFIFELCGR
jgi:hypothetical protein